MHQSRIRLECLKLATELCKVASAFDRPQRVIELAKEFEGYCLAGGEPIDPGRQMPGDPPADPPEKPSKGRRVDPRKYFG